MAHSAAKQWLIPRLLVLLDRLLRILPPQKVDELIRARSLRRKTPLFCPEYAVQVRSRWKKDSPHKQICERLLQRTQAYSQLLRSWNDLLPQLRNIPLDPVDALTPAWRGGWIPPLDALSIYSLIATRRPGRFVEIGSGNSTRFARRAISDFSLPTEVVSIDPSPRAEIDLLCDQQFRTGLEDIELSVFDHLEAGDVVYVDCSHRVLQNSDVTVFFLDVLPRLPDGVLVGIHDIFWPLDYPDEWIDRHYSEQYLLGQLLLSRPDLEVVLPAYHASVVQPEIAAEGLRDFWSIMPADIERHGGAFWFTWTAPGKG